ncbi:hypothetical protein VOLCADRAFT_93487 [Volvox carteri f. nagariensis]|uniref:EF-hand domain-containing protein n=1 Tax=Volvox carteri f. nagariensis TaxID=3068 RepID=D8U290_VOLCA|nr:uncharacterized protein VOLCADRAFT_93487 [Volvox carteri f. nagariensis]EFJ46023.1 hypothetical protein VOLCADRAFT_93487 [Volvox carteri f. nagariensis]|eukprot:XP_002952773.1 hypothetical protein VOLCADRAFT_93487 [Volvox carteri f. nagariensis]
MNEAAPDTEPDTASHLHTSSKGINLQSFAVRQLARGLYPERRYDTVFSLAPAAKPFVSITLQGPGGQPAAVAAVASNPLSPETSIFAAAASLVHHVDLRTASVVQTYGNNREEVNGLCVNGRGTHLAAGDDAGEAHVYDLTAGRAFKGIRSVHRSICSSVAFRAHKPWDLITGGLDATVAKYDFSRPKCIDRWDMNALMAAAGPTGSGGGQIFNPPFVHQVAVPPAPGDIRPLCQWVAAARGDGAVVVLDADVSSAASDASGPTTQVMAASATSASARGRSGGGRVGGAGGGGKGRSSMQPLVLDRDAGGHTMPVCSVAFAPYSAASSAAAMAVVGEGAAAPPPPPPGCCRLYSAAEDCRVILWDVGAALEARAAGSQLVRPQAGGIAAAWKGREGGEAVHYGVGAGVAVAASSGDDDGTEEEEEEIKGKGEARGKGEEGGRVAVLGEVRHGRKVNQLCCMELDGQELVPVAAVSKFVVVYRTTPPQTKVKAEELDTPDIAVSATPPPLSLEPSGREVTPPPPPAGGGAAVGTAAVALTPRAGGPDSPGPAAPAAASGSGGAASGFGSTVDGLSLVVSLPTEDVHPYGSITGCSSHPLFASYRMPTSPPTLPRLVLAAPPAPPPAQWDDAPAPDATAPAEMPGGASPARTPRLSGGVSSHAFRTPPPLQPFAPPGPSGALAAPGSSPLPGSSRRFTTALSPSSRPHTSLSVQELSLPRPGKHLGSRSPTRGSWTPLMNVSWAGSANGSVIGSSVTAAGGGGDGGGGGAPAAAVAASTTAASSSPSPNGAAPRFQHTATRWASMASSPAAGTTAGGAQWGSDSSARTAGIKVTRGMLYSVFQELDEFDSGRLTYSAFEQAACRIGMRPAQAKRLFEQWVRSMHMAIQMAMLKLQLKRSGRAVSLDRLVQAFAFMDRDGNGALNAEEVVDAVMKSFDKDGNGCVDYFEFVKSLYPTRDSVYHH